MPLFIRLKASIFDFFQYFQHLLLFSRIFVLFFKRLYGIILNATQSNNDIDKCLFIAIEMKVCCFFFGKNACSILAYFFDGDAWLCGAIGAMCFSA